MTVNTEASVSIVRSLVRSESTSRTYARKTASDASEFSRVLHTESVAARQSEQPTTAAPAPAAVNSAPASNSPAAQALHYNVQGLVTARGEASIPPATVPAAPAQTDTTVPTPTAEGVFGANPWMNNPTGYSAGLGSYNYNPLYFATRQTAEKVAQLLGGTVVENYAMVGTSSPFIQNQANYMVQLPNGHLVNAGLTASYYTHGWSQAQIDQMLGYDRNV